MRLGADAETVVNRVLSNNLGHRWPLSVYASYQLGTGMSRFDEATEGRTSRVPSGMYLTAMATLVTLSLLTLLLVGVLVKVL